MDDRIKLTTEYYKKYVGAYAKRFYAPFRKDYIYEIVDFCFSKNGIALFMMKDVGLNFDAFEWDVEDCVIITNEQEFFEDERVANVYSPKYEGYNPYNKQTKITTE